MANRRNKSTVVEVMTTSSESEGENRNYRLYSGDREANKLANGNDGIWVRRKAKTLADVAFEEAKLNSRNAVELIGPIGVEFLKNLSTHPSFADLKGYQIISCWQIRVPYSARLKRGKDIDKLFFSAIKQTTGLTPHRLAWRR